MLRKAGSDWSLVTPLVSGSAQTPDHVYLTSEPVLLITQKVFVFSKRVGSGAWFCLLLLLPSHIFFFHLHSLSLSSSSSKNPAGALVYILTILTLFLVLK